MKQSGECPKCQGHNIWNNSYFGKQTVGSQWVRKWVLVRGSNWPPRRRFAFKDEFVCLDCGYSESYVDRDGLESIKEYGFPEDR